MNKDNDFSRKGVSKFRYILWLLAKVISVVVFIFIAVPWLIVVIIGYIVPSISIVLSWLIVVLVSLLPLIFSVNVARKKSISLKRRILFIVSGILTGAALLLLLSTHLVWSLAFGYNEDYNKIQMEEEQGMYAIGRIGVFPEGEVFTLYEIHFFIFQTEIASSGRRGDHPTRVDLYQGERDSGSQPSFRYDVKLNILERLIE